MLKIFFILIAINTYASEKNSKKELVFLSKDQNLNKELSKVNKENKNNKILLSRIFDKSLNRYLVNKKTHKGYYVNHLFKSKYKEIRFNEQQIKKLSKIKANNIKKARKKIKVSKNVLEKMKIDTLKYYRSKEKINEFLKDFLNEHSLSEENCGLKSESFHKCFIVNKNENSAIFDLFKGSLDKTKIREIDKGLNISMTLLSLKSGSEDELNNSELLRMSFFLNGVILNAGDF